MISLDNCLVCKQDNEREEFPCHRCGRDLNKVTAMALSFVTLNDGVLHLYKRNSDDKQILCTILFCCSCFEKLAGKKIYV